MASNLPCINRWSLRCCNLLTWQGFTSTRKLLADSSNETPISSPLTPALALSGGKAEPEKPVSKPSKVQAVLKGIKQVW